MKSWFTKVVSDLTDDRDVSDLTDNRDVSDLTDIRDVSDLTDNRDQEVTCAWACSRGRRTLSTHPAAESCFNLTQCLNQTVSESQLPHTIVNLLFTMTN